MDLLRGKHCSWSPAIIFYIALVSCFIEIVTRLIHEVSERENMFTIIIILFFNIALIYALITTPDSDFFIYARFVFLLSFTSTHNTHTHRRGTVTNCFFCSFGQIHFCFVFLAQKVKSRYRRARRVR